MSRGINLPLSATEGHTDATDLGGADPTLVHGDPGGSVVRRSVLPGGVRVLTEAMPGQRSATIGFWVGVGSRDEAEGQHPGGRVAHVVLLCQAMVAVIGEMRRSRE